MKNLRFFYDLPQLSMYVITELIETLKHDLDRMQHAEARHYTDEDRSEMEARIEDIQSVSAYFENLSEYIKLADDMAQADPTDLHAISTLISSAMTLNKRVTGQYYGPVVLSTNHSAVN